MNEMLIAQLTEKGWALQPQWLDAGLVRSLASEVREGYAAGDLRPAQVGTGAQRNLAPQLRGDRIFWLEEKEATSAQSAALRAFETLRAALNRELMLGLFELEAHFALYPPGAFYGRHVDRFRDDDARVLSVVLYLNEDWNEADGGQLRLETEAGAVDISPQGGTLVAFLSERFPHEVLPARRERLSLTGWFKRRSL